jgi:putative membrane protein
MINQTLPLPASFDKVNISIFSIWLVTISGIIGILLGKGDWFLPKTPANLLLGAALLYWNFPPKNGWKSVAIWSVAFLSGFTAEALGVNYGLFFGDYHYGNNLGPKVLGVPLTIGINWVVLTFSAAYLSRKLTANRHFAALLGATMMVALDFLIEPLAPVFDFWHWDIGYAPLQNFVSWFVLAWLLQYLVRQEVPEKESSLPLHHFASQVVFFGIFFFLQHV